MVDKFTPEKLGLPKSRPIAVVKLQTVQTIPLYQDSKGPQTVGQAIDEIIADARDHGHVPNRVAIDLNPSNPVDPADVDSF